MEIKFKPVSAKGRVKLSQGCSGADGNRIVDESLLRGCNGAEMEGNRRAELVQGLLWGIGRSVKDSDEMRACSVAHHTCSWLVVCNVFEDVLVNSKISFHYHVANISS
jgi:hypothetical protein